MPDAPALIPSGKRTLTGAVMVTLDSDGLQIPGMDIFSLHQKHAPLPLELPELLLLEQLALGPRRLADAIRDVAAYSEVDAARLEVVAAQLAARGLLVEPGFQTPELGIERRLAKIEARSRPATAVLHVSTPWVFRLGGGRFEHIDHEGALRASFAPVELAAVGELRRPVTPAEALTAHRDACGTRALGEAAFADVLDRVDAAGVLVVNEFDDESHTDDIAVSSRPTSQRERAVERRRKRFQRLNTLMRERAQASEAAEREERGSLPRVRVVSVQQNGTVLPLALGMIVAKAKANDGGRLEEDFVFHPDWLIRPSKVESLAQRPSVYLLSNYNWSHRHNLSVSKKVKELSSGSVTIHGGPNTPKYEADCEAYFRANPDVDIAVRGEGELAVCDILAALAGFISDEPPDLSVLHNVRGISFREGDRIVRTPDRERIDDLDALPSPILTGLFDDYAGTELGIIETNRGCPFRCSFCDWGSATASRNRKFSLERVFAELEWCAAHEIAGIICADANFGFLERDVEIAEKVAELKRVYGYPKGFSASAAKNTTKYTNRIIQILADADVMSNGSIGVQSMDPHTLRTIRRSNIKVEKYDELANEFRRTGLSLWVDLMMGLPGQTVASFENDLQGCVDRGVFPRIFLTELLVNSPMNEPSYRAENRIETEPSPDGSRELVVATSTFTREEYEQMNQLRLLFLLGDVIGMLRHIAHFVRSETGMREIDFYERLRRDIRDDPERWPTLAFSVRAFPELLVPPGSWHLPIHETRRYVIERLGLNDDALTTVVKVQQAVLPARDRVLPQTIELEHDYASWHSAMVEVKEQGHLEDWQSVVPPLHRFGRASFTVDDPDRLCEVGIGATIDGDLFGNYELRTPVARWTRREDTSQRAKVAAAV